MLIPVHLDGQESPLLVALDGPSLRVRRAGSADVRLPLRRLARITVRGPVTFAAEALPACLEAGVPVAFLDPHGHALGLLVPMRRRHQDLAALVDEAVAAGRFPAIRRSWRAAVVHAAAARTVLALGLALPDLRPDRVHRAAARAVDTLGAAFATEELYARLFALGAGLVAELLLEEGAGARFQGLEPDLDLAADLREVLALDLWPVVRELAAYLARHRLEREGGRALQERVVRRFEAARPQLALRLADAGLVLRRLLREAIQ